MRGNHESECKMQNAKCKMQIAACGTCILHFCILHFSFCIPCFAVCSSQLDPLLLAAVSRGPSSPEPPQDRRRPRRPGRSLQGRAVDPGGSHAAGRQRGASRRAVADRARRRRRAQPRLHAARPTLPALARPRDHGAALVPLRPRPEHVDGRVSRRRRSCRAAGRSRPRRKPTPSTSCRDWSFRT